MSVIKRNILANFAGRGWASLMSLIFVPLYIEFMGVESYGLVGIFASLQALFSLLDMGLSTTLNRELARLSVLSGKAQEMRNLVRTLEVVYWWVGIFVALAVVVLSSPIAFHWVKADKLSPQTVRQALMITGGIIAFQWPLRFYSGGLMGLQKQVLRNCIEVGAGTLRGVGAVLVLWLVCPTILGFFIWQIFVTFLHTLLTAVFLWNSLPRTSQSAHFQKELFFRLWRFAVGLTGISIASLIFSQTDKIILSRILTLEMFGYYAFAVAVSKALYLFIDPISSALFPRFSQLASLQNQAELKQLYHKVCQLMSSIVFPPTVVVALFSSEILLLWTGNPLIVANTHIVVSFLIIGSALNGLMYLPFALQLSHGWIKLALYSDIVSIIVFAPLLLFLSIYHGAVGASVAWVILNAGYVLVCIQIMHLRILKGEQWQWYFNDVGIPLLGALGTALVWRVFAPDEMSRYAMLVYLTCVSVTALFASIVVTPYSRFLIGQILINFKVPSKKEIVA